MIYQNLTELMGNTPLFQLNKLGAKCGANIICKLEMFNPAGSVKDRVGKAMIEEAEASGKLKPGGLIVEPTSGNTGVGLAAVAAAKGYKVILTMPETMSVERRNLLKAYGAEIVLTKGSEGMKGAIGKAQEIVSENPEAFMADQFNNQANWKAHFETTGPEIWAATEGKVDILVSGIGTGGTITGVGAYLKAQNTNIQVVAVEPFESPVLSGGAPGPHKIQGIGAGFVPGVLDTNVYDQVVKVPGEKAMDQANILAKEEGILCGISSGAAIYAALEVGSLSENQGKNIVVILPDTGERYLSTGIFE